MWYTPNETLSKNRLFNFQVGMRGVGKTVGSLAYAIRKHLKDPNFAFAWVRRYDTERKKITTSFFNDIVKLNFFPDCTFTIKNNVISYSKYRAKR